MLEGVIGAANDLEKGVNASLGGIELGKGTELNERASGDFLLRMNAKASMNPEREFKIPETVMEIGDLDEVDDMDSEALKSLVKEIEGTVTKYFKTGPENGYKKN